MRSITWLPRRAISGKAMLTKGAPKRSSKAVFCFPEEIPRDDFFTRGASRGTGKRGEIIQKWL
jgi:hypothetical protein